MGFYKYYRHSMENWNKTFPSLSHEERLVALYEIFAETGHGLIRTSIESVVIVKLGINGCVSSA